MEDSGGPTRDRPRTAEFQLFYWLVPSGLRAVIPAKSRWCCWAIRVPCTAPRPRPPAFCTPLTLCLTDLIQIPGTSSFHLMQSQQTSYRKSQRNQMLNHTRSRCSSTLQPPRCLRQPFLQDFSKPDTPPISYTRASQNLRDGWDLSVLKPKPQHA